jgi:serine/threonine-protein kinase RsbW
MANPRVALDVEIPSDVKYIEEVVELATRRCRELHLPSHKCSLNLPVALSEALSNAILRGNAEGNGKHVRVTATVSDDAVVFDVADQGPDFDMVAERIDPTTPENVMREEGRGLFLMYRLMDAVEHIRDHGNVVRLTLRRE